VNLFQPYTTKFEFNYDGPENCWDVVTRFNPATYLAIPPTTISYSRRLFRSSPQRGEIVVKVAKQPSLSFLYQSPPTLKLKEWEGASPQLGPPTTLGLKYVLFERSCGLVFEGVLPYLIGRVTMSLVELSVDFKASIQYGLTGLLVSLGAKWSNENVEVASTLALNPSAIVLELE
jgi:DnaJ family protein C protein 11